MTPNFGRPRVVLDSIIFGLQQFGGISNYWGQLVASATAQQRFDTTLLLPSRIVTRNFDASRVQGAALVHERLPARLSGFLAAAQGDADVFHTSYYRVPRRDVGTYVVTVYDFIYERYRTGPARWVYHRQQLHSIRRADVVICISECTRRDVLAFCPEIDPAQVHIVPLAVDHHLYFKESSQEAAAPEPKQVLFVGQRRRYKRFDLAVEGIRQVPDLQLGIVGPALSEDEQANLRARLGNRWVYHGAVPVDELRRLYANAFCFVFPSDYEGFGLPTLEAMACGCPVVSSSAASLPEVGGTSALYAVTQDADAYAQAFRALRQPEVRARLAASGLAHSRQFSWRRTCEETFALYPGSLHGFSAPPGKPAVP